VFFALKIPYKFFLQEVKIIKWY